MYEDKSLFPVYPGGKSDSGRYVICNKPGSGPKSPIWLAKDQQSRLALKLPYTYGNLLIYARCFVTVKLLAKRPPIQRQPLTFESQCEWQYLRNFSFHWAVRHTVPLSWKQLVKEFKAICPVILSPLRKRSTWT